MTIGSRSARRAAVLGLVMLIAGCGVPIEDSAAPIPDGAIAPIPTTTATSPSTRTDLLWFVREDGLVAVKTNFTRPLTAAAILQALATGPTSQTSGRPLRTIASDPLTGLPLVSAGNNEISEPTSTGSPRKPPVTVTIAPAFSALPSTEQMLLLGQVVLSLTAAGWPNVTVTDESGSVVAVPLPNGRLLDRPAVARDYATLKAETTEG